MARAEVSRGNPEGGPQTAGVRFCAKSDSEYNCATSARGNWAVDAKGALKLDAPSSGQSLTCLPPPLPLNACSPLPHLRVPRSLVFAFAPLHLPLFGHEASDYNLLLHPPPSSLTLFSGLP